MSSIKRISGLLSECYTPVYMPLCDSCHKTFGTLTKVRVDAILESINAPECPECTYLSDANTALSDDSTP